MVSILNRNREEREREKYDAVARVLKRKEEEIGVG